MKNLVLVRHAKSSWEQQVSDKERPLKQRGFNDAKLVSEKFNESESNPDQVFTSPAKRALQTCHIFVETLGIHQNKVHVEEQLYDFSGHHVLTFLKTLSNTYNNVMIFGHNHAFTDLANTLGHVYIDNLPTSGLVYIEFKIDCWQDIEAGQTKLTLFPRDLK